jgi:hypothetical protein
MKGLAMPANDMTATIKLALLIDGDNVSAIYMPIIMREAGKLGAIAIRRIYGQFKSGKMNSWQKQIDDFNLTPVNVSPLVHGKNATDMKLVIEAMDIMNRRNLDGFCIASSDGDFTPLVSRIRHNALSVYGFGAKKAPAAYREEFERFYECDTLLAAEKKAASGVVQPLATRPAAVAPKSPPPPKPLKQAAAPVVPSELREKIFEVIERTKGSDGLAHAGRLGHSIRQAIPDLRVKDYGFSTIITLVRKLPGVDVTKKGNDTYVSRKRDQ